MVQSDLIQICLIQVFKGKVLQAQDTGLSTNKADELNNSFDSCRVWLQDPLDQKTFFKKSENCLKQAYPIHSRKEKVIALYEMLKRILLVEIKRVINIIKTTKECTAH